MKSSERALVVISELSEAKKVVPNILKGVYDIIDTIGIEKALYWLGHDYDTIKTLTGKEATSVNFINAIINSNSANIKAIDVLIHLHGNPLDLYFEDKMESSSDIGTKISSLNIGNKLSMLFSTACYGANHANDFVAAGFKCASGAIGVNVNPGYDYKRFLYEWSLYNSFSDAINKSANAKLNDYLDKKLKPFFPQDIVDSNKVVRGNGNNVKLDFI